MGDRMKALEAALERIVLDPRYHTLFALLKGIRNGVVYGTKVRLPHALVMIFLFRSGTFRQKLWLVFKATRQHAKNLAMFAVMYKSSMSLLRYTNGGKEGHYDAFFAGLVGGYTVFGRTIRSSVSQQIVIYVFARVCLAAGKLLVQPRALDTPSGGGFGLIPNDHLRKKIQENGWVLFATLSWASVMYVFRWHPETLQSSLRSSMQYIYVDSDHWDSLATLVKRNK